MDNDGAMQTGWVEDGGYRYFLDASGLMKTKVQDNVASGKFLTQRCNAEGLAVDTGGRFGTI